MSDICLFCHTPIRYSSIGGELRGKRRIGFLVFNGITALDLAGPMEAFGTATGENGKKHYELVTVGITRRDVIAENVLVIRPSATLSQSGNLDTIIIPGGSGLRDKATNIAVAEWINTNAKKIRRIVSICTGIYGVAASGLLDGREVTTHWRFANDVQRSFPRLRVNAASIFLSDGKFYTSAGITAGIDLSLALIEEDCGRSVALSVARELVMFLKRPGGQEQYSGPLRFQIDSTDKTGDVAAWIEANLERNLSVPALAKKACLSERQFARRFKAIFNVTPAAYVERVRLERARAYLCESSQTVEHIAREVGFTSDDAFRRSFQRQFKVSPRAYRSGYIQQ
jgi:transcriptional regulator GlxA family with amidase domain